MARGLSTLGSVSPGLVWVLGQARPCSSRAACGADSVSQFQYNPSASFYYFLALEQIKTFSFSLALMLLLCLGSWLYSLFSLWRAVQTVEGP